MVATLIVGGFFVPLYWSQSPSVSFPWLFDLALVAAVVAIWRESRLLTGMTALSVLLPELVWNISFLSRLVGGADVLGFATPGFDPAAGWGARAASLAHVVFPLLLVWMLYRLGYDRRALPVQTLVAWAVLLLSYALAETPASRMAWALGVGDNLTQAWLPGWVWLLLLMLVYPALVYLPTHLVLSALFGRSRRRAPLAKVGRMPHAPIRLPSVWPPEPDPWPSRVARQRLRERNQALRAAVLFDLARLRRR